MAERLLALTGASGFVGRHLAAHFLARGWKVRGLARDPARLSPGVEPFRADLPGELDARAFAGARAVIHAAYFVGALRSEQARRVNEEGTARVLAAARAAGVPRFVFVSSLAAHEAARSYYARSKRAIEATLDPSRDLALRPGLVLGPGGLYGRMAATLRRTRLAPAIGGGDRIVQTVHVGDLCAAFERALERGLTGELNVAEPDGLPLRELLRGMARAAGVRAAVIPVPARPLLWTVLLAERLGLSLPISGEDVLGALALRHRDTTGDLARLGLTVRSAAESLQALAAG